MNNNKYKYDLAIIGSGPAGYRAAIQAAKLGKKICIIEKTSSTLGGSSIHKGTIPSKTLRETLDSINNIKFHAGAKWVNKIIDSLSIQDIFARLDDVSCYEKSIIDKYINRYNIESYFGHAKLKDNNTISVVGEDNTELTAKYILLATGSRPRCPVDLKFDNVNILDADSILKIKAAPKRMLIYGAGVIGCEYACIFNAFGIDVTLMQENSTILPYLDRETVDALMIAMTEKGITVKLGTSYKSVTFNKKSKEVDIIDSDDNLISTEVFLFTAGRTPNSDAIGLENTAIKTAKRGHIIVNENYQTAVKNIYAAGDVIGPPALAATSGPQGRHAACHMFTLNPPQVNKEFPIGVYTIPEMSCVGMNEKQLQESKIEYIVGRAHYREIARGYIRGDEHGLLKILFAKDSQKILGVHIVGYDACNLVHIGQAFMQSESSAQDILKMILNYPTLAEAYHIASFNALNKIFKDGNLCLK